MAKAAKKTESKKETLGFEAETGKILQLMIHSLYTNRDIFLRELISNASDACDKLRFQALTKPELLGEDKELKIQIAYDEKANTLTVTDNGIGMSRDELKKNLGTIARSGTQEFVKQLSGDKKKDAQLIGQFGVGFYASFMVADRVQVISRKAGAKAVNVWESTGDGKFTIESTKEDAPRGTSITLHLREDAKEYLDKHRLSHIVKSYSDHIGFPVELLDAEGTPERLNSEGALWQRPKSEITDEQYTEFYHHVAHAGDEPFLVLHNKVEGVMEYTNLLFIPSKQPFDLFHPDRKRRVKLYVKRVFITEENVEIIPQWLRFLQGVVDSEDLPLNISRETLQANPMVQKIRKSITNKVLSELKTKLRKDTEAYDTFWQDFGAAIKEGLCEPTESSEKILEICRFHHSADDGFVSLDAYVEKMGDEQDTIYFLAADSLEAAKNNPQLEGFKKKGTDVILLSDHVDDFWTTVVHEYKGKKLQSITRAGVDAEEKDEESKNKKDEASVSLLVGYMKTVLGETVADVQSTSKLDSSPVCLASSEKGMDMRLERFLVEQNQLPGAQPKILEINPEHPIIQGLAEKVQAKNTGQAEEDLVHLLYDQAAIVEGMDVKDRAGFARRLNRFLGT